MTDGPITNAELDEWERIEKAATPGRWYVKIGMSTPFWYEKEHDGEAVEEAIMSCGEYWEMDNPVDAALTVTARNAFPRLIAEVRQVREQSVTITNLRVQPSLSSSESENIKITADFRFSRNDVLEGLHAELVRENRKLRAHIIDTVGEDGLAELLGDDPI